MTVSTDHHPRLSVPSTVISHSTDAVHGFASCYMVHSSQGWKNLFF